MATSHTQRTRSATVADPPARRRGRPPAAEQRTHQVQMRVTQRTRELWEALRARLQAACPAGRVTERDAFEWLLLEDARRWGEGAP